MKNSPVLVAFIVISAVVLAGAIVVVTITATIEKPDPPLKIRRVLTETEPFDGVTFIIPSVDRSTLSNTLDSLLKQTNPQWNAVVVFDGVKNPKTVNPEPSRIEFIALGEKVGHEKRAFKAHGNAALVRNHGMQHARHMKQWIGFVDDDDTVDPEYVSTLAKTHFDYPYMETVIFRMKYTSGEILPPTNHANFRKNKVGISFAYRKALFQEGLQFKGNSDSEDFDLLDSIRSAGKNIYMHPSVMYYVKPDSLKSK